MKITSIELKNYRNYPSAKLSFDDGLNVFEGNNAQGKTNMLEAILFCAIGKSLRCKKDVDVIGWGSELASIKIKVKKQYADSEIMIVLPKGDKKTVKVNGFPIRRMGELMGELNAVFFTPDEMKLVKEEPHYRRRFMDIDISQMSKGYFYLLGKYEKILASRNKLLKEQKDRKILNDTLPLWNAQLADAGSGIVVSRQKFLQLLAPHAEQAHSFLTSGKEKLQLVYEDYHGKTRDEIKADLLKQYDKNLEKDLSLGFTTVGPHRDDFKPLLDGMDVRSYGSQGQQRSVALSLKLAELEIMKAETGEMPVLILDDVLSELDEERRGKLLELASKTQVFLSATEFDFPQNPARIFRVENGRAQRKS